MPIEAACPSCSRQFRVPDKVAGRKIKCPKCQGVLSVPGSSGGVNSGVGADADVAAANSNTAALGGKWYLKTPDGAQYGPVAKTELDQWHAEGRITPQCHLLEEGAPQWQWATDVYPAQPAPAAAAQNLAQAAIPAPAAAMPAPPPPNHQNPFDSFCDSSSPPTSGGSHSSDPFSFAGADTSPTSRIRGGKRGSGSGLARRKKSDSVTMIAMLSYALGTLGCVRAVIMMIQVNAVSSEMHARVQSEIDPGAQHSVETVAGAAMGFLYTAAILLAVFSTLYFIAGYGVQERRQWGRIFTFILAVITGLVGLFQLLFVLIGALGLQFAEAQQIMLWILGAVSVLISLAYALGAFIVLLQSKNAEEFR